MENIWNEISDHLPVWLRAEAEERVRQAAPHYLWYWGKGKSKRGYCTACRQTVEQQGAPLNALTRRESVVEAIEMERQANGLYGGALPEISHWDWRKEYPARYWTHKAFGCCPACGAVIQFRQLNLGRRYMNDTVYLCHYSKSAKDTETYVMTLWHACFFWSGWHPETMREPETDLRLREVCLMKHGAAGQRFVAERVWTAVPGEDGNARDFQVHYGWVKRKQCKSGFDPGEDKGEFAQSRCMWVRDEWSVESAFHGTRVAETAATLDGCAWFDGIDLYHAILRYPCIEYLCKLGYGHLARLIPEHSAGTLMNLRGKNAQAVLKLDGNTYGWLRGKKIPLDAQLLQLIHARDKLHLRLGNDLILALHRHRPAYDADFLCRVTEALPPGKREKAIRYALKNSIADYDYLDHLKILTSLNEDLNDDQLILPRDFAELHGRLAGRAAILKSKEKDLRIRNRAGKLAEYQFSALGLIIRPMLSAAEIIHEGAVLHHCVGTYVDRYAKGETILLCLREESAPRTPKYTVEFSKKGTLVQCRGYKNGWKGDEWENGILKKDAERIAAFWKLFAWYRQEWRRRAA